MALIIKKYQKSNFSMYCLEMLLQRICGIIFRENLQLELRKQGARLVDFFQSVSPTVLESHIEFTPAKVSTDLKLFGKTDALVLCAKLNLLTSDGGSNRPNVGQVVAVRLLQKDGILSEVWYNKLREHFAVLAQNMEGAYVINRPSILEFMRWITARCSVNKVTDFSQKHVAKAFFRTLLTCSEFYGSRELQPTLTEDGTLTDRRFQFLPGLHRAATWAGAYVNPIFALGRAQLILIEHFFDKNPTYLTTFEQEFGITIKEYMACAAAVVLMGFLPDSKKENLTTLNNCFELDVNGLFLYVPVMQPKWLIYLDKLSQSADELGTAFGGTQEVNPEKQFDFRPLRSKPILRFGDKVIVLDQRLFVESYSAGPLFVLTRALRSEAPLEQYGVACQNYAYQLLERTNQRLVAKDRSSALLNEPRGTTRPVNDIILNNEDSSGVVLIEAKGVWLNDNVLYQSNADNFWTKILEKYGVSIDPRTGEEKRKGTAQLADVLHGLFSRQLQGLDSADFINRSTIFIPVLIMQDYLMSADLLLANQLAIEFSKLMGQGDVLPQSGNFTFENYTIHSLIPLTLQDLEILEALELDTSIFGLFSEYSREVPLRADSFSTFLRNRQPALRWLADDQRLVSAKAKEVLERVRAECFG